MVAQIKQGDHATWAITPHVFVGRKKGRNQILWKWYSTTSGQSPCLGSVRRKASSIANCTPTADVTPRGICGVCRFRLLQTRTWPSAPIPSTTGRPQKICLSWGRSPTLRVSLAIANYTPTADVTPRRIVFHGSIRHSRFSSCSIRHSRFSSSKFLEQFLKSATNCGCLARVPSQKTACARGWRRVM